MRPKNTYKILGPIETNIEAELFDVLTPEERKNFDLSLALKRINKTMGAIG